MRILLTGGAGFIGFHAGAALLASGHEVTALDSLNAYYDPALKKARLGQLAERRGFRFAECDIADAGALKAAAGDGPYDVILHLAAQAGVRYGLIDPGSYTRSNLIGHQNILEFARHHRGLAHLVYASSSSVYGNDSVAPFSEDARADKPVSYYGATKRAGELLSHSYAELFGLKQTGLRFFTVYGPWGRPDMAMWLFAVAILDGKPINLFNNGKMRRDFTYVDDVVQAVTRLVDKPAKPDPAWSGETPNPATSSAPWRIYNIGNNNPVDVPYVVDLIEQAIGKKAARNMLPMQAGDVPATFADVDDLIRDVGFKPSTPIADGVAKFVAWYMDYRRGSNG
jgi:UDP-glucuronate 4-epimerase